MSGIKNCSFQRTAPWLLQCYWVIVIQGNQSQAFFLLFAIKPWSLKHALPCQFCSRPWFSYLPMKDQFRTEFQMSWGVSLKRHCLYPVGHCHLWEDFIRHVKGHMWGHALRILLRLAFKYSLTQSPVFEPLQPILLKLQDASVPNLRQHPLVCATARVSI